MDDERRKPLATMTNQERRAKLPAMTDLIAGRLYKTKCRAAERMADGFTYSVWNGTDGFVGIRLKFNSRFVEPELHYDASESFGTVNEAYDTGIDCPIVAGWTEMQWIEAWKCDPLFAWLDEHAKKLGGAVERFTVCYSCEKKFKQVPDAHYVLHCQDCIEKGLDRT